MKGIFWPAVSHNQSRNYVLRAPALPITELPYHALAPIGSAAGKALWHVKPTRNATFDVLLCLRVPPVVVALLHACCRFLGSAHVQALEAFLLSAQCAWPCVLIYLICELNITAVRAAWCVPGGSHINVPGRDPGLVRIFPQAAKQTACWCCSIAIQSLASGWLWAVSPALRIRTKPRVL